ncbi:MAG: methyltransferase domain-containing protein [Bacteroidetes bacterium]|nr:methyltransferase domain-containing protein [Bacteroidota bacterium]
MKISIGQDEGVWTSEWDELTPDSEIRMWDYFGLRQWISKFTPRYGKTVEAGSGLGRYVLYFSRMGIDIEGVDFSGPVTDGMNKWTSDNGFNAKFVRGNVLNLDYPDNSLSGYISLGVVEHFIEGPQKALSEAYRVLKPGGVAVISTPSRSFYIIYRNLKTSVKNLIKKLILYRKQEVPFFQYWYRPSELKNFMKEAGFDVRIGRGADLQFVFCEMADFTDKYIHEGSFGYNFSNKHENGFLSTFGAQSITISVKRAPLMSCFLCGEMKAGEESLDNFVVPVCKECGEKKISGYYKKSAITAYSMPYKINPPLLHPEERTCDFCGCGYTSDPLFEDYGFSKKVCPSCLGKSDINITLCCENIKPVWRKRKKGLF